MALIDNWNWKGGSLRTQKADFFLSLFLREKFLTAFSTKYMVHFLKLRYLHRVDNRLVGKLGTRKNISSVYQLSALGIR